MNKYKNILPYNNTLPKFNGGGILSGQSTKYSNNKTKAEELDTDGDGIIGVTELGNVNPNFDITNVPGHKLLDATSWIDPSPISDWSNASTYAAEGNYANAALYGIMGVLPAFVGKVAKQPLKKIVSKIFKNNTIENTTKQSVKQVIPDWSKGPRYYNKVGTTGITDQIGGITSQGKWLDELGYDASTIINKNVKYIGDPTKSGRVVVEVALPNGKTQLFYKSSGLANKSGKGVAGTTEGLWQPFGGYSNQVPTGWAKNVDGKVIEWKPGMVDGDWYATGVKDANNWHIKSPGYENFYGSKSYQDIANQLDRIGLEEGWDMSGQILKSQRKSGGEEKSIDDQSEREWLKNWLNTRKETGRFDDQLNEDDLAKYINNINTVQQITRDQSKKMFPNSNSGYLSSLNSPAGSYTMDPDNPNVHHYFSDPTLLQSFTNMFDSLDNEGSTKVHELTHAMTRIEGSDQLREAFPNKNWKDYKDLPLQQAIKNIPIGYGKWYNDPDSFDVYERDPEEILAQLMEYRKNFNVDPNRIFTEDDIEEVKKNVKKQGPSGMFGLNIFTPENTIRLLNEVAQVEPSSEMDLGVSYAEFGGDRTTALRNFMYDKKRNKPFAKAGGDLYEAGLGSWLKSGFDKHKDTIQKYADYASYVPVVGKAAGFVSAGIDGYDAYNAYQAGDMETYKKERNKALTTAAFSGTPGQYVKGAIKSGIKQVTPQLASKTAAHVTKTGIKDTTKELQDTTKEDTILDYQIPSGVNVTDPRNIASAGTEIDETRQLAINQKTNEILNQIESDWDMKTQQNRNNVTSKTNMPGVIQFVESTPTFSQLSNISESEVLGLANVNSPFKYKYYTDKNKNSDINKKYLNNISINNDISKIENFKTEQGLMTSGYYGKDNWDNYNFVQHNDVVKLQKELVNNGYDIGDSNNEIVNRTIEERYKNKGVDAKYGPKTSKAYSDFELDKLNLKDKNIITASYYNDLIESKDVNWKFNSYNSKNKKFNYNIDKTYNQEERISYIESVDGIMSPNEYQETEDILNFMDTAIPEMAKDMLIQVDHNWITTTVLSMMKEKTPVDLSKIDPAVLEYFDIDDFNIKDDPKKLALATAYNVINNYSKIKEHLQDENVSEDQIRNASTFGLGKKYENKRPNQYFDQEVLEHQLMTAANLRTLLQDETVTNKNKILSNNMSQEIFLNETNALNIVQEDIDKMINTSPVTEQSKSSLGGEIKKPKYTGKYAKYGYQLDSEWEAKKKYENGEDIDLKMQKALMGKEWIKPRKNKKFKMSTLPTHIILNSLDLKFMKRGGDYPDMETKIKIYDDYLNGVFDNMDNKDHKKKANKIVNKLNRFYMYDARDNRQHVFDYMKSQLDKLKNK